MATAITGRLVFAAGILMFGTRTANGNHLKLYQKPKTSQHADTSNTLMNHVHEIL